MKIAIIGPGAMGCLFAAFLSRKNEVILFDKDPRRAKAIDQQGIKIEGISGKWSVKLPATNEPKQLGDTELFIICVKSYDTKKAVSAIEKIITETSMVLTVQNGVGNIEIIGELIGHDKVIGGVTNHGATLLGDGHIRHAGKGETIVGRIDGKIPTQMRGIREILNKARLETRISRDIKGLLWSKLIINVGINALTALTRLHNGRLVEFDGTRNILGKAVAEAVRVAKRKRIKLIYDDPLAKVEAVCEATAGNIASMLQDILKKKKTEINFINGVIIREGQSLGIPTPVNTLLVELVKTLEESYALQVEKQL
ncbi:ketopantoate reductase family protein [Candidatus Omnitrophota bacterium]